MKNQKLILRNGTMFGAYVFVLFCIGQLLPLHFMDASSVSEDFSTSKNLKYGVIAGFENNDTKDITLASLKNEDLYVGVVSNPSNNSVNYEKENANVTVTLAGEVEMLVSNLNGNINNGDTISISWLDGVGMKATSNENTRIVAIAQESLEESDYTIYDDIDTPNGTVSAGVGQINVRLLSTNNYINQDKTDNKIESIASSLLGKPISLIRILFGATLFLSAIIISGTFVGSSIHASTLSIGRNPMASAAIYRNLTHITFVSVVIILIGASLSYAVLVV